MMIAILEDDRKNFAIPENVEDLDDNSQGISTDLVPTLLNMYDALYARLSEPSPDTGNHNELEDEDDKNKEKQIANNRTSNLFIIEENYNNSYSKAPDDVVAPVPVLVNHPIMCEKCGLPKRFLEDGSKIVGHGTSLVTITSCICLNRGNVEIPVEHDYDIPEFIEKPSDELKSILPLVKLTVSKSNSPLTSKRCRNLQLYRPLSSISSSSSSSSNSLPRVHPTSTLGSYLASAESLEDHESNHQGSDAENSSRRRDRGLKARREKALRAGSDDSGVQCHSISLPVPPSIRPRYCDPNLNYMDRVVLEIVETEEIYVRDLKEVIEGYLHYWKSNTYDETSCISPDVAQNLFSNIEQIFHFNRGFLRELELCGTDPVLVAKCFVRNNTGFAIYTEYCTNYPRTVSVLTDLMRGESSVKACRERQLALGHTLPLGSYLLKPVQRVLKYHLLLGNIVKHFNKDRPGHEHIWNALSGMTGIAHHINDMKRKHEHAVRVQEIQSLLYGWQGEDLTTFGELAAEGAFRMFGAKGLRHVFLFDKILLITKKKDENILMYKAHIMCSDLMLIEAIPREPLSFHVIPFDNPKRQYTLECRNMDQKREWTQQLKRVILENYSANIPPHARQLVMELGQNNSSPQDISRGGRRGYCAAPQYLEKRKDRRRASEGGFNSRLRIRRSGRKEKENRSRSASRTRETDEDEEPNLISPTLPSPEKSKLRLPMWRRRSEPGIRGRLSLPTSPESVSSPGTCSKILSEDVVLEEKHNDEDCKSDVNSLAEDKINFCTEPLISSEMNECDSLYEGDLNEEVENENLEEIVSHLLHAKLQVQQEILNKKRRCMMRKKNSSKSIQYETSDTENEEEELEDLNFLPPLPKSPPPPLSDSNFDPPQQQPSFSPEYIDRLFKPSEQEWSSEASNSIASSSNSINRKTSLDESARRSTSVSRSGSDIGTKNRMFFNYDNLTNIWNSSKRVTLPRNENPPVLQETGKDLSSINIIRRIHSFSNDHSGSSSPKMKSKLFLDNLQNTKDSKYKSETPPPRPATIAIYDTPEFNNGYCPGEKNGHEMSVASSRYSVDNLVNVHPDHKIYSKASVNRGSIKKVLCRITNPRGSKTISEPSNSLSNIYMNSEFEPPSSPTKKSSNLVSSMARQCSRTLKERIKQIRTEDETTPKKSNSCPPPPPKRKQGNSSIGARLATTNDNADYAVPSTITQRPDSFLSSASSWTTSSFSPSNKEIKMAKEELMIVEDVVSPMESDQSGDSFYEKSFEAIEALLEDEMFRDSAIYSEPEDGLTPTTLSPKSSFRSTSNKMNLTSSRSLDLDAISTSKAEEIPSSKSYLNDLSSSAKRNPPPVPLKPDAANLKKFRPKGSLIQQQLKNLELSKNFNQESNAKKELVGIKTLSERREELKNVTKKTVTETTTTQGADGKISFEKTIVKKCISENIKIKETLRESVTTKTNERKNSLDSYLNVPQMGFSYSPNISSSNLLKDCDESDETIMSKGWVKHVIGRLQQ